MIDGSSWIQATAQAARLVLGVVFVFSGVMKAITPIPFLLYVSYFGILPWGFLNPFAGFSVIGIEVLVGAMLVLHLHVSRFALPATGAMLIFFNGLLVWDLFFREAKNCLCLGAYLEMTPTAAIAKNVILLLLVCIAWTWYRDYSKEESCRNPESRLYRILKPKISPQIIQRIPLFLALVFTVFAATNFLLDYEQFEQVLIENSAEGADQS